MYKTGSVEALHTEKGHLPEIKYQELGRKRAPNFTADRGKIYKVFLSYEVGWLWQFFFSGMYCEEGRAQKGRNFGGKAL